MYTLVNLIITGVNTINTLTLEYTIIFIKLSIICKNTQNKNCIKSFTRVIQIVDVT